MSRRRISGPITAVAVLLAACSPSLNWREVRPEGSDAVMMFPCKPQRFARQVPLAGGKVEMHLSSCTVEGVTYALSDAGLAALRERKPITLTKPFDVEEKRRRKPRAGEIECDEALFEQLRMLRRKLADERDVPAYVVFSDVSLREMARSCPTTASSTLG